jgi:putative colanic acid biosysnthesis UDP-glucose lipid carrier transferase
MLRRTNIDELPRLINVLRGEMPIVGPRPHATAHNRMFEDKISVFSRRHVVKPGITGWAQVNGYRGATDTVERCSGASNAIFIILITGRFASISESSL